MELDLFGGMQVRVKGREVRLWPRGRHLLSLLALCSGTAVPADVLIFHLWPDKLPADPGGSLHEFICRLRKALGDVDRTWIRRTADGYSLNVEEDALDITVFRRLAVAGIALASAEPALAESLLRSALQRSDGALPDLAPDSFVAPRLNGLEELRALAEATLHQVFRSESGAHGPALQQGRAAPNRRVGLGLLIDELPEPVLAELVASIVACTGTIERLSGGALAACFGGVAQALRAATSASVLLTPNGALTGGAVAHLVTDADLNGNRRILALAAKAPAGAIVATAAVRRFAEIAGNRVPMHPVTEDLWQLGGHLPAAVQVPGEVRSPFTGREEILVELAEMLRDIPLVTLRGPGGIGKTRLASVLAASLEGRFGEVGRVDLAEADRFGDPVTFIANRLGSITQPDRPILDTVVDRLSNRKMLLLLDNAEVFIDEVRRFCDAATDRCPDLRIVATSRSALAAAQETVYDLAGLPQQDAAKLLLALAFPGSPANQPDLQDPVVVQLCSRLDGIPLAIECLAPLVVTMGGLAAVESTLDGLPDGAMLPLLDAAQSGRGRHRSIELALVLSHRTLTPDEAKFFERLSCLRSTFTTKDASVAAITDAGGDIADALSRLSEVSLLQSEGPDRWRMLEPIRQFAATLLLRRGEDQEQAQRHGRYFVEFAERSAAELRSPDEAKWFERLTTAYPNLVAALTWAIRNGRTEDALRLSSSLHWYWAALGMNIEGANALERALELPGGDFRTRAKALCALAHLSWWAGDPVRCESANQEALMLVLDRTASDTDLIILEAWARTGLAASRLWGGGKSSELAGHLEIAEALFTQTGDYAGLGIALGTHGAMAWHYGDDETHLDKSESSLAACRKAGHQTMIGQMKRDCGLALGKLGRYDEGRRMIHDGLRMARRLGDTGGLPMGYGFLGLLEVYAGRPAEAAGSFLKSLKHNLEPAQKWAGIIAVAFAAEIALDARPADCLCLCAFVEKQEQDTGIGLAPKERSKFVQTKDGALAQLEAEGRSLATKRGEAMTLGQAMELAIALLQENARTNG